jgi:hypothetical protein
MKSQDPTERQIASLKIGLIGAYLFVATAIFLRLFDSHRHTLAIVITMVWLVADLPLCLYLVRGARRNQENRRKQSESY